MRTSLNRYIWRSMKHRFGLIALMGLCLALSGCFGITVSAGKAAWHRLNADNTASQWAMEGANLQRNRQTDSQLAPPLKLAQTLQIEADTQMGSPVSVSGQRLFIEGDHRLHVLSLQSKRKQWSVGLPGSYISPAISGDRVLVRAERGDVGHVFAFNQHTGEQLWAYQFPQVGSPYGNIGGHVSSPLAVDGLVLIGASRTFCALDLSQGNEVWLFRAHEPISSSASVSEETVFFTTFGRLYALDIKTGQKQWHFEPPYQKTMLQFAPIIFGDTVVTAAHDTVYALSRHTGQVLWQWTITNERLIPAGGDSQHIYIKTTTDLYALDRINGSEQWHFETVNFVSLPAITQNYIYVITQNTRRAQLQAIQLETGISVWQTTDANLSNAAPAIAAGQLFVKTEGGQVLVYQGD